MALLTKLILIGLLAVLGMANVVHSLEYGQDITIGMKGGSKVDLDASVATGVDQSITIEDVFDPKSFKVPSYEDSTSYWPGTPREDSTSYWPGTPREDSTSYWPGTPRGYSTSYWPGTPREDSTSYWPGTPRGHSIPSHVHGTSYEYGYEAPLHGYMPPMHRTKTSSVTLVDDKESHNQGKESSTDWDDHKEEKSKHYRTFGDGKSIYEKKTGLDIAPSYGGYGGGFGRGFGSSGGSFGSYGKGYRGGSFGSERSDFISGSRSGHEEDSSYELHDSKGNKFFKSYDTGSKSQLVKEVTKTGSSPYGIYGTSPDGRSLIESMQSKYNKGSESDSSSYNKDVKSKSYSKSIDSKYADKSGDKAIDVGKGSSAQEKASQTGGYKKGLETGSSMKMSSSSRTTHTKEFSTGMKSHKGIKDAKEEPIWIHSGY